MARAPESGVFLERRSYRRRRLIDGLKLLPFLGAWFFLLPIFWPGRDEEATRSMSGALLYLFGVWFGLIVLCAVLGWWTRRSGAREAEDEAAARQGRGQP